MDRTSGGARRHYAPLAFPALDRVAALLQVIGRYGWLSEEDVSLGHGNPPVVSVGLDDDVIYVRAERIDKMWVLSGPNIPKIIVRMGGTDSGTGSVLVHLRPLVRRGLEIDSPCVAAVLKQERRVVGYSGPLLHLDADYDHLRDLPDGGWIERLVVVLGVVMRHPAGSHGVHVHTWDWCGLWIELSPSGQLLTAVAGDIPRRMVEVAQVVEYARQRCEAPAAIDLVFEGKDCHETVGRFCAPSFDLQPTLRVLL